jgi:hypothetical protein
MRAAHRHPVARLIEVAHRILEGSQLAKLALVHHASHVTKHRVHLSTSLDRDFEVALRHQRLSLSSRKALPRFYLKGIEHLRHDELELSLIGLTWFLLQKDPYRLHVTFLSLFSL